MTDVMLWDSKIVRRRRHLESELCCRIDSDGWCCEHHRGENRCAAMLAERPALKPLPVPLRNLDSGRHLGSA